MQVLSRLASSRVLWLHLYLCVPRGPAERWLILGRSGFKFGDGAECCSVFSPCTGGEGDDGVSKRLKPSEALVAVLPSGAEAGIGEVSG